MSDNRGKFVSQVYKFISQGSEQDTEFDAGIVLRDGGEFIIGYEMKGAENTFSIGQPVYDEDLNIMGWLGIGLFDALDYATDKDVRIPCEYWKICLPTKYCEVGKKVYTYWQMLKMKGE